jgi:RND family efflux transporter MFP subunit
MSALANLCGLLMAAAPLFTLASPPELETDLAILVKVPLERRFDGTVEAVHQSTVSAQVAGRIEEIYFDVDDYVAQGDVLLRFRNPEQRAGLERAEANMKEARALEAQAKAELQRIRSVFERKLVSQSAMDKAEAEYKAAAARLQAAEAAVMQAQEKLEHTLVRAPYSGIVTERHVELGETATVGQALMSGISLEKLRITSLIPQAYIEAVRKHRSARVYLPDLDAEPVTAEEVTVFPYAESGSHSFRIRVTLPEGIDGLYPGMVLKVAFQVGETEELQVPVEAVVERSELTALYVVDEEGGIEFRQVRLGERRGQRLAILAGLSPGERIVRDPILAGVIRKQQRRP